MSSIGQIKDDFGDMLEATQNPVAAALLVVAAKLQLALNRAAEAPAHENFRHLADAIGEASKNVAHAIEDANGGTK